MASKERIPTTILDLPEEVIRLIFDYLSDAEIYFEMRNTCLWLRSIADNYVHIGKFKNKFINVKNLQDRKFNLRMNNNFSIKCP